MGTTVSDFALRSQAGDLVIATGGSSERMRITTGGNVGIGTTAPTNVLDVSFTASAHTSGISTTNHQSGGYGSALAFNSKLSLIHI